MGQIYSNRRGSADPSVYKELPPRGTDLPAYDLVKLHSEKDYITELEFHPSIARRQRLQERRRLRTALDPELAMRHPHRPHPTEGQHEAILQAEAAARSPQAVQSAHLK